MAIKNKREKGHVFVVTIYEFTFAVYLHSIFSVPDWSWTWQWCESNSTACNLSIWFHKLNDQCLTFTTYALTMSLKAAAPLILLILARLSIAESETYNTSIVSAACMDSFQISFTPTHLNDLIWRHSQQLELELNCSESCMGDTPAYITLVSTNDDVIYVIHHTHYDINCSITQQQFTFDVYANRLGHANLTAVIDYDNGHAIRLAPHVEVTIEHDRTALNDIFIIVIAVFMVVLSFGFGCRMQLEVLQEIMKKPVAPAIGLVCQFVLMPIVSVDFNVI